MEQPDAEFWDRVTRARDELVEQFLRLPGINMVDIGVDPEATATEDRQLVLRVHVDTPYVKERMGIPDEVEGIPVRLIVARYKPD